MLFKIYRPKYIIHVVECSLNIAYQCENDEGIYKYTDGETIGETDLSKEQVHQFSDIIAEFHLHVHGGKIPLYPTNDIII